MADEKPQISYSDRLGNLFKDLTQFFNTAANKLQNIARSNIEMGIIQMRQGRYFDAALRFRIALWFESNNAIAHYLLGKAYVFGGKREKAVAPLTKALQLNPELNEAKFLLAICGRRTDLDYLPRSFIIERNDTIADNYNEIFPPNKKNNLQLKLEEEFTSYFQNWQGFTMLEIGTQGGEIGDMVRGKANALVGVEPSIKMSALAKTKRHEDILVYNKVVSRFPEDYLAETEEKYQVILAIHYLSNIANPDHFMALIRSSFTENGGVFIFTITPTSAADFEFADNKILFRHSEKFIEELLTKNKFRMVKKSEVVYESGATEIIYFAETI